MSLACPAWSLLHTDSITVSVVTVHGSDCTALSIYSCECKCANKLSTSLLVSLIERHTLLPKSGNCPWYWSAYIVQLDTQARQGTQYRFIIKMAVTNWFGHFAIPCFYVKIFSLYFSGFCFIASCVFDTDAINSLLIQLQPGCFICKWELSHPTTFYFWAVELFFDLWINKTVNQQWEMCACVCMHVCRCCDICNIEISIHTCFLGPIIWVFNLYFSSRPNLNIFVVLLLYYIQSLFLMF